MGREVGHEPLVFRERLSSDLAGLAVWRYTHNHLEAFPMNEAKRLVDECIARNVRWAWAIVRTPAEWSPTLLKTAYDVLRRHAVVEGGK
jgi:hypothetical protein